MEVLEANSLNNRLFVSIALFIEAVEICALIFFCNFPFQDYEEERTADEAGGRRTYCSGAPSS